MPTSTSQSIFLARQARLEEAITAHGFDALALNPGSSLTYLTGLGFHLMERPVTAIFAPGQPVTVILPELERLKLEGLSFPVRSFAFGEDPARWPDAFAAALQAAGVSRQKIAVEPTRLRFLELRMLEAAAPAASFVSGEALLSALRISKDEQEVAAMRTAVEIAQQALQATLPFVQPGKTERQIAAELTLQLLRHGSEPEMAFSPIVSGGPNSANPHASPSDRPLQTGDLLVIDWGAIYHGYVSDLTRTFAIGPVDAEYTRIAEIVKAANAAGRLAAGPGVAAQEVDRAARDVIEQAGYGQYFTHRTGHGIGLEGHEPPYMREGNDLALQPGMAFTVEPGIYLPGRNGVRIEDNVVITVGGAETLSNLPRELITLPV